MRSPNIPLLAPSPTTQSRFIAPTGAGAQDGTNWANAAPLSAIDSMVSAVGRGGRVCLAAHLGTYANNTSRVITHGGVAGSPVTICGVNADLTPAHADIVGNRASPWSAGAAAGVNAFMLMTGADHLVFTSIKFTNQGSCIRIGADIVDLTVSGCTATNVQTFFENLISGVSTSATITGLIISNCTATGYSKRFARIQYNSSGVLISGCTGDSDRQDGDNFAVGVALYGTAHGITVNDCVMRNHIDTTRTYQNGDGFSSELGNYSLTFNRCEAYNNTDGGFDLKSDGTVLNDCHSEENHRNYRIWGLATLNNCVGVNPTDNAGANPYSKANVSAHIYAMARVYGGSFSQTNSDAVFRSEQGGMIAVTARTMITKPGGAPLSTVEVADSLDPNVGNPAGVFLTLNEADTAAPTITSSASLSVQENNLGSWMITANEGAQLRVTGGADAAYFTTYGPQLRLSPQDYELPVHGGNTLSVEVTVYDQNGNASVPQAVTATITNQADDPLRPPGMVTDGVTDFVWLEATYAHLWQDAAGTVPAAVDQIVARMDDQSSHGHHVIWSDPAHSPYLRSAGGLTWLDMDGDIGDLGAAGSLQFAKASITAGIRRGLVDTTQREIVSVPRSLSAPSNNEVWRLGVTGGASFEARNQNAATANVSSGGTGASLNVDKVLGFQSEIGKLRTDEALISTDDTFGSAATMTYPVSGQPVFGASGNRTNPYYGRFYGMVITNRTEAADFRFRIANEMAKLQGRHL
ncbi:MAG: hypothetical protein JWP35_4678 [Caulobacter sp.]|nr:hypothetical protein [Caulobacter sp.]